MPAANFYVETARSLMIQIESMKKIIAELDQTGFDTEQFLERMVTHRARTCLLELQALQVELRYAAQISGAC